MSYFSILIPAYNQVGKMDKCIESVLGQSFGDYEVIMVDDGSTDATYDMLKDFEKKDGRFHAYHYDENGSLIKARYTGMQQATGQVIVFLDSDDYLSTDALSKLHDKFEKTDADIVRFGFVFEPEGREILPIETEDVLQSIYDGKLAPAIWRNAYRKRVIEKAVENISPFYCNMGEDSFFSHVFFTFGEKVDSMDDVLYHYETETGMSASETENKVNLPKFRKSMKDVTVSSEHFIDFVGKFAPQRNEEVIKARMNMWISVFFQFIANDKDYRNMIEYMIEVKNMGLEELFDHLCNVTLKKKVLYDEGYLKIS